MGINGRKRRRETERKKGLHRGFSFAHNENLIVNTLRQQK